MKVKITKSDILIEVICIFLLVGITLYLIGSWSSMPDKIPMHYNVAGQIDRWGKKAEIIFIPAVSWFLYLLISVSEQFPQVWNTGVRVTEENAQRVYRILKNMVKTTKLLVVILFSYMTVCSVTAVNLSPASLFLETGVIFGNLIFWMVKLFRNR